MTSGNRSKEGKRYLLHDLQNTRAEVTDMLFFRVSPAQCLGPDADEVVKLYEQKLKVSDVRQNNGYSMKTRTGDDNKDVGLG